MRSSGAPSKSSFGVMGTADQVSDMSPLQLLIILVADWLGLRIDARCCVVDQVRIQHDCSVHVAGALLDFLQEQFDGRLTHPIARQTHEWTRMLLSEAK